MTAISRTLSSHFNLPSKFSSLKDKFSSSRRLVRHLQSHKSEIQPQNVNTTVYIYEIFLKIINNDREIQKCEKEFEILTLARNLKILQENSGFLPVASQKKSVLPLMQRELAKSFPSIPSRIRRSDWVRVWSSTQFS